MMKTHTLFFLLLCPLGLFAQTFKGKVTGKEGTPIPYATLFFRDLGLGFTADGEGRFQTCLNAGEYNCEVSSLGYEQKIVPVVQTGKGTEMNIQLDERIYQLQEVRVSKNNEDPAYAVMRQAIARAPFYRTLVKSYTANSYLKGSGKMTDVPAFMKMAKDFQKESDGFMNRLFVMEAQHETVFTAPNQYKTEVKAFKSSFPEELDLGNGLNVAAFNLYSDEQFGKVSPLSSRAFSFYRFKLEACYMEGDRMVNKIKLLPKRNNNQTLTGYLYIIEDLWCISNAEIQSSSMGVKMNLRTTCKEIKPDVYLPASSSMRIDFGLMGVKGYGNFFTAVNYKDVVLNETPVSERLLGEKQRAEQAKKTLSAKQQKLQKRIDELAAKEELTTGEAYKMAKLMEKQVAQTDTTHKEHRYERDYSFGGASKRDSLATKRDSIYWAGIRSAPLLREEQLSYARKDSMIGKKSLLKPDSTVMEKIETMSVVLLGHTFYNKSKTAWIELPGIQGYLPGFSFVDGFPIGAKVTFGKKLGGKNTLLFTPSAYYTTASKTCLYSGDLTLQYLPRRNGKLTLEGGRVSADYNNECGMDRMMNSVASILFARNEMKLYEKKFIGISNCLELANGLQLSLGLSYERRNVLVNHYHKSTFGKKAKSNIPGNIYYSQMPENELMRFSAALEYTPAHYYYMYKGRKKYEQSKYPTFMVRYEKGFSVGGSLPAPDYNRIDVTVDHTVKTGFFSKLAYRLNAGTFLHADNLYFPDYRHFDASRFQLTASSFDKSFALLNNYEYSTPERWGQAHLSYYTSHLFLKWLPFLKNSIMDEGLHIRALAVRYLPIHTEVGYSIGIGQLSRAGIFVGFRDKRYRSVGFSIVMPINLGDGFSIEF